MNSSQPLLNARSNGGGFNFAGWSQTGEYYCFVTQGRPDPEVYDVNNRVPSNKLEAPTSRPMPMSLISFQSGSPWCSWEENLIFSIRDDQLQLADCESGLLLHNLKIPISRPVAIHCHQTRPLIIIGNSETDGRLQLLSAHL